MSRYTEFVFVCMHAFLLKLVTPSGMNILWGFQCPKGAVFMVNYTCMYVRTYMCESTGAGVCSSMVMLYDFESNDN